jgi:hypothetical protein
LIPATENHPGFGRHLPRCIEQFLLDLRPQFSELGTAKRRIRPGPVAHDLFGDHHKIQRPFQPGLLSANAGHRLSPGKAIGFVLTQGEHGVSRQIGVNMGIAPVHIGRVGLVDVG